MALALDKAFSGQAVLLTGGLGFLGSVTLERLLRCTQVRWALGQPSLPRSRRITDCGHFVRGEHMHWDFLCIFIDYSCCISSLTADASKQHSG
jgi:nucleoside-diphosphate-sugar epimerase